jgi:hypothetical protein
LKDHQRFIIQRIDKEGAPTDPEVRKKLIQQCGVLVRDYVPIIFREWKPVKGTPDCYVVGPAAKKALWIRLMKNFVLPLPEVASDEEVEPDEAELKRRSDRIEAKSDILRKKRWLRHSATGRKS